MDYKCWKSKVSTKSKTFSLDYKCWKSKVSESKTFTMDFECWKSKVGKWCRKWWVSKIRNIWIREGGLEDALGHAGWQWMLCKGQTQSLQFVHCSVTARWRIVAVSSGLENPPLDNCNWRVQSDSDGAARSSPYLEKRKCVSTSLMWSAASCVHQDTRHLH